MDYVQIEGHVEANEYQSILNGLLETFSRLKEFSDLLIGGVYFEPNEAYKLMMESAGYWDQLKLVHATLDTIKTNREKTYFQKKKMEVESVAGGKFNTSATEGEAEALTVELRRVRNIVGAYMDMADKNIMVCQSLLKYVTEAQKRSHIQEG